MMMLLVGKNRPQSYWPCSTSVFTSSWLQVSGTQTPTKYVTVPYIDRNTLISLFCVSRWHRILYTCNFSLLFFYLPEEHLAVLSREGWSVGRVTLLQHACLVNVTSSHIAAHLPVRIIHWYTACTSTKRKKKHVQTNTFKFCKEQNSWLWFRDVIIYCV